MLPPDPQGAGKHAQGILGLALAIEQECSITLKQSLRDGYDGHRAGAQQL